MTATIARRMRRATWLVAALVIGLVGTVAFLAYRLESVRRDDLMQRGVDVVTRVSTGAQLAVNRGLLGVDTLLVSTDDMLQSQTVASMARNSDAVSRILRSSVEQNLLVRYVAVLDEQSRVLASSDSRGSRIDVHASPEFIQQIVLGAGYHVHVSAPTLDWDNSETVFFLGRMVRLNSGEQVVAIAQVQVGLLRSLLAQGLGISGLQMTLEREDGMLLVSVPAAPAQEGRVQAESLRALITLGVVQQQRARVSEGDAFIIARKTLYPQLWLSVAVPLEVALTQWRLEQRYIRGVAAVLILFFIAGGLLAVRYLKGMEQATARVVQTKAVLDEALNAMPSGFLFLDKDMRLVGWNRRYEEMTPGVQGRLVPQMAADEVFTLVGQNLLPAQATADEVASWVKRRRRAFDQGGDFELTYPDGRHVKVSVRDTPDGGRVCVIHDMTEERLTQADLRVAAKVFDSQEGMMVTDGQRRIVRVNQAFTQITGYQADEVLGQDPKLLNAGQQNSTAVRAMWDGLETQGHWQGEVINRRKDGATFHAQLTITSVKDEAGHISHYVATMLDVTSRKTAAQEIERLAFYDPLTELPNRRLLMDRLRQALAGSARTGHYGALLFLDLDHFKVLNDTQGHDVGDDLLRTVAQRLRTHLRETDTVARLGGDEFVVLLGGLSENVDEAAETTRSAGEKILRALNQPFPLAGHEHHCSTSIGAVLFCGQAVPLDDLLKQADLAMYDAKAAGRGTLRFFDPQMQAAMAERAALEKDLRGALAEGQFELHYQAQVTHARVVVGAEVLLRWLHPTRGMVSPAQFIPLAEETGLIVDIGQWVLDAACAQLALWQKDARLAHLQLAVNVSALQFQQSDFVTRVQDAVQRTGVNPTALKLELTESAVVQNMQDIVEKMRQLKAIGLGFSMDDFGTGQSSLAYLTRLPLDQLKVDQSFVRNIGIRNADALMVQTIVGMAHSLGLQVIAEGVETEGQRAFLEKHDCGLWQGYLFARPQALRSFEASLTGTIEATIGTGA